VAAPSNFDFLRPRWRGFHAEARRVERDTLFDPLSTCFFAGRTLEVAVGWMYREGQVPDPWSNSLSPNRGRSRQSSR